MSERRIGGRLQHDLRVADHQRGRTPAVFQRADQFALLHHDAGGIGVEDFADSLHLRQDQPTLRRAQIDRDDQHDQPPAGTRSATSGGSSNPVFRRDTDQRLAHCIEVASRLDGDADRLARVAEQRARFLHRRFAAVGFVEHAKDARLAFAQSGDQLAFERPEARLVAEHEGKIDPFENLPRLGGAQRAEIADIVDAGGIDEHNRPKRRHFNGFFDRVGRGARDLGNDRHRESEQRIHQAGLADIAPAEQANMHAQALGRSQHVQRLSLHGRGADIAQLRHRRRREPPVEFGFVDQSRFPRQFPDRAAGARAPPRRSGSPPRSRAQGSAR